jgi:hypothetical protein
MGRRITMFKRKKKKTGVQTPEFRKPTPPPPKPPTSGSNARKPNPNYVPPASVIVNCGHQPTYTSTQNPPDTPSSLLKAISLQILPNDISTVTYICPYETPCGWCTKWDKKCDKKISGYPTIAEPVRKKVESDEGLSCFKCKHYDSISSVCSDCHPIFKHFEAKEN